MTHTQIIVAGDFLLTMDSRNRVILGGAVLVADGRIVAVDRLVALRAG
jgi:5-methylthioadenosine/S-adenosylhomocysteine deaminase